MGQDGEHTFIRKALKCPHLSIYNRKYLLHFACLNCAHAYCPRGFGDLGRIAIYFKGAREH